MSESDYLFKIVILGDGGVGKTALLEKFTNDSFMEAYVPTIGVDFRSQVVRLDGNNYKLQIWDTAGNPNFRAITSAYNRGANGFIVVYDASTRSSFEYLDQCFEEIKQYNVPILLVASKSDKSKEVTTSEGQKYATVKEIEFVETSAALGENVAEPFMKLARLIKEKAEPPNRHVF